MINVPDMADMEVESSHQDVNGSWGGYKAWVVHYRQGAFARTELYRHVGSYYEVGNWPDDYGPSKWEVVNRCVEFLDGKLSLIKLIIVLMEYRLKDFGTIGRVILLWDEFTASVKKAWNSILLGKEV